jgi:acyl-homoserine lactone acylase PvdQ
MSLTHRSIGQNGYDKHLKYDQMFQRFPFFQSLSSSVHLKMNRLYRSIFSLAFSTLFAATADAEPATLYRDSWGVPHAYATSESPGFYALGYAQAEDRLEDVYLAIRTAIGRLSEVKGKEFIDQDYLMLLTENHRLHQTYLASRAPQQVRKNLEAFAAGINAYIKEHPSEASDVAIKVEAWHPLAIGRAMILRWPIGTVMGDLRNAPEPSKPAMGSNQWAVSPQKSETGSAILLSDPHLTWEGLSVLYEARVHAGNLHMNGYFLIGSPMLAIGHNLRVGWALTTGGPDTSDVYRIKLRLKPNPEYEYDGLWKPIRVENFSIPVKDSPKVTKTAFFTHLGPVIGEPDADNGTAHVGASPYFDQTGLYEQFYQMAKTNNVYELNTVLARHQYNEQNVMSADIDGNIAYVRNGATPIRPSGYDWTRPVDGTTSKTAWLGIHPQKDLVQIYNPPQGYMQNCNVSPSTMMVASPLTPDKYPDYIFNATWDTNNPRGRRTVELLHNDPRISEDDAIAYALDIYDRLSSRWKKELRESFAGAPAILREDAELSRGVDAILNWDGYFTPEATSTNLYKFWRLKCGEQCNLTPLAQGMPLSQDTRETIILLLKETMEELTRKYGKWEIPWGDVHVVGRNNKYFPAGGADFSSGNKDANFSETLLDVRTVEDKMKPGRFIANSGSMAMILMFFDKDGIRSFTCTPWGQSANPNSDHHVDQAEHLYSQRKMKSTFWSQTELLRNLKSEKALPSP